IFIFFVSVTVAAVNAQWFGQMTSEIMADMHLIEQTCGLGQDIGLSSNREAYAKLCSFFKYFKCSHPCPLSVFFFLPWFVPALDAHLLNISSLIKPHSFS
ncbi:hypothetical protein XENOCAPTIV_002844, partial [Xenoophorus captivus]